MKVSKKAKTSIKKARGNKLVIFGGIVALAAVATAALITTRAATTNFEAESASRSSNVTTAADSAASGGTYAKFSATQSGGTGGVVQRFPGDPNPKVTKKAYWGADELENTTYKSRFEDPTGKSLSVARRFYSSWSQRDKLDDKARTDLAANRLPMYSIKPVDAGWNAMASGTYDSQIDAFLRELDTAGGPIWLIVHHEPDGGGCKCGPENSDDPGGPAAWVKMQQKFRQRMNAVGTKNVALMAAMTGGWGSKTTKDNWWAPNTFDGWFIDLYYYSIETQSLASKGDWSKFVTWAENKNIPYGTAELGIRSGGKYGVGYWTNSSTCSNLVPRGISSTLDNLAGQRLREFWEWGSKNNKDVIGHAYFDKCANSGDSPYAMGGQQLVVFRDILKNDSKVARVNEFKSGGTPGDYGTITSNVSIPTSGTYKVWARMNAPDSTNNAFNLQIDGGTAVKVGDGGITANTWTWVDWKNGSTTSKNTFSLTAGNHEVKLTGIEPNVKVDRIIVTDENCVPTGTGDNCTTVTPEPQIAITSPTPGQTVQGTVAVNAGPSTGISQVIFLVNGQQQSTDTSAPFSWNWDTTSTAKGQATITIRASGPGVTSGNYIEKSVTVNVQNTTSEPTPKQCDFTGDGLVGLADLSRLLSNYGRQVNPNEDGDCTGDGLVGLIDLSTLLARYGK